MKLCLTSNVNVIFRYCIWKLVLRIIYLPNVKDNDKENNLSYCTCKRFYLCDTSRYIAYIFRCSIKTLRFRATATLSLKFIKL